MRSDVWKILCITVFAITVCILLMTDPVANKFTYRNSDTGQQCKVRKMQSRQQNIKKNIKDICRRLKPHDMKQARFATDPYHKLLQCMTPKVGTSFWSAIFRFLHLRHTGKLGDMKTSLDIPRYQIHESNEKPELIFDWRSLLDEKPFTYVFARDPYPRLWSVYVDKEISWKICEPPLNFTMFLKIYGTEEVRNGAGNLNNHYRPVSDMCDPCVFRPDFIGTMETFADDISYILDKVGLGWANPQANKSERIAYEVSNLISYNYKIQKNQEPFCENKEMKLAKILWKVFQINGYIRRDINFPEDRDDYSSSSVIAMVTDTIKKFPLVGKSSKRQRNWFMKTAYSFIPPEIIEGVQIKYQLDFEMFGYNKSLEDLLEKLNNY